MPEVEPRSVAADLCIEWRIPIGEIDGEAELAGEEGARCSDVADEQLRLGGVRTGPDDIPSACLVMAVPSVFTACPLR